MHREGVGELQAVCKQDHDAQQHGLQSVRPREKQRQEIRGREVRDREMESLEGEGDGDKRRGCKEGRKGELLSYYIVTFPATVAMVPCFPDSDGLLFCFGHGLM